MPAFRTPAAVGLLACLLSIGCMPPPEHPPSPAPSAPPAAASPAAVDGPFGGSWVVVDPADRTIDAKGRGVAARTDIWREGDGWLVEELVPGQARGKYAVRFVEADNRLRRFGPDGKVADEIRVLPSNGHLVWRSASGRMTEYRRP